MKVFTAEQMRAFDRAATEQYGIPSIVLMENAALCVVEFLEMKFTPLKEKKIVVLCGKGNNGGDGFAIARHLETACRNVTIIMAASPKELKGDALLNYQMLTASTDPQGHVEGPPEIIELEDELNARDAIQHLPRQIDTDIYIDALLGTGSYGEIRDQRLLTPLSYIREDDDYMQKYRQLTPHKFPVRVAVDLPSTLNADTGEAPPIHHYDPSTKVGVDYTVSLVGPKRGMFLSHGIKACGEIWIGDIGTRNELLAFTDTKCECITHKIVHYFLPHRPLDAHKGDAGRVVICGGSYGMSGAPTLASRAVLRSGAGLCITCVPDRVLPMFAAAFSEATSHPLACDEEGRLIEAAAHAVAKHWESAHAVALGPGLSRSEGALNFARRVVRECPHPLVIDADALYALRAIEEDVKQREAPTILTPHPGEMGELMEMETKGVQNDRIGVAVACAQRYNAIVVLKGARSIVALPNGNSYINLTGNSGMATGGSGDVLTGTIAGLLAQLKDAKQATLLGVYLHGLAGDLAYSEKGNGLIAGDIAESLPRAMLKVQEPPEVSPNGRLRRLY